MTLLIIFAVITISYFIFRRPIKRSTRLLDMETKALQIIEMNRINDRVKNLKSEEQLISENSSFWGEYK